ncbi:putative cytochrome c peroxidase [Magnetofaba australis IT-1]|uniref:Putative cytochrome c peroxidase n=1 Tax=Magnetofaba australis IT-1 TaxID=1434232 RepID=A0A1Y2JYV4_9PROT|nr:putative cytochrome c peroxidase [Magnetofaba australis IT-1]
MFAPFGVLAQPLGAQAPSGWDPYLNPLQPLPSVKSLQINREKAELGGFLFHDLRLSRDDTISCATCHPLNQGGVDQEAVSTGVGGRQGGVNAPTVLNSGLNFRQFWDGRARDLFEQAAGPVHNPVEMDTNWREVAAKLQRDAEVKQRFDKLYADGVTGANIQDAIAAFEKTLLTPSPFDRFMRGDPNALNADQKHGYALFISLGCASCHQGRNIGGNAFQKFGVFGDYLKERGGPITQADLGRYNVTGRERDRGRFKIPSLRNVALTPPYFHDGSVATLNEAVRIMAQYQLGRRISDQEITFIVAFLSALSGELPEPRR